MEQAFSSMFGGGKKKMPKKGGHVLGGSEETKPVVPSPRLLDITFCNESLGIHLTKCKDSSVTVKKVETNSEASRAGVKVGFKVMKLQGDPVGSYEMLIAQIQSCGRPCSITFEDTVTVVPKNKQAAAASSQDNAARREASVRAAETRNAAWDKKMSNTRVAKAQSAKLENQKTLDSQKSGEDRSGLSAESAAAFEVAKKKEADEAQRLGFNPYKPIFGSSSQGRAAVEAVASGDIEPTMGPSSPTNRPINNPQRIPEPQRGLSAQTQINPSVVSRGPVVEYEPSEALSMALALLSSHSQEVSDAAISTCLKLMNNLINNFSDDKYHKVRMNNKAFSKKVATVSGGTELMNAAGFVFISDEATDEMLLVYPMLDQPDDDLLCAVQHLQRLNT